MKIDRTLRKALLRALEKLDEEDPSTSESRENSEELLDVSTYRTDAAEEEEETFSDQQPITVKEEDPDEEVNADVFIHTINAVATGKNEVSSKEELTARSKDTNHEKNFESLKIKLTPKPNEVSVTPSVVNRGVEIDKGVELSSRGVDNTINGLIKLTASTVKVPSTTVTQKSLPTPSPTSSTPVEEEDVSKVKAEDVQFIHAPLVAAFTVQQDDKGLPQKVIPLFGAKHKNNKPSVPLHNSASVNTVRSIQSSIRNPVQTFQEEQQALEKQIRLLQEQRKQEEEKLRQQLIAQEQLKKQFLLQQLPFQQGSIRFNNENTILNDKKPSFEQQVAQQQIAQQQLLQQQQITHLPLTQQSSFNFTSSKDVQIHKAQSLPVQNSFKTESIQQNVVVNPSVPANVASQNVQIQKAQTQNLPTQNSFLTESKQTHPLRPLVPSQLIQSVQVQPSLSFQPNRFTSGIVLNGQNLPYNELYFAGQQPPIKEAVNFQQSQQVPFFTSPQTNVFQQQLPLQFSQHTFNNDNLIQDLRIQLPPFPPNHPQSSRVFRHESQTGNFGINDFSNRNRFNHFNSIQNQFSPNVQTIRSNSLSFNNRPFEHRNFANSGQNHYSIDTSLRNLFYQSGFGQGRSQEDFNIVSKVLALDHTR